MQTIKAETNADLMAAWRATGGASWMTDERLAAAGDDGLQAGRSTASYPFCVSDDGPAAAGPTYTWPCVDDGLQAGIPTMNPPFCVSDDGLQAGAITLFYGPCIGDDGLQARAAAAFR